MELNTVFWKCVYTKHVDMSVSLHSAFVSIHEIKTEDYKQN